MKLTEIHVYQIDLPVRDGPYTMSGIEVHELDSTVVRIVTSTGLQGYGEVCPVGPVYQPEHALGARAALAQMAPSLIGLNPLNLHAIRDAMDRQLCGHNYAKAAIDVALWDLAGKHYGVRVCDLLGGPVTERVPAYYAVGVGAPDEIARQATEMCLEGYCRLQIKIGGRPVDTDIETVRKVWESVGDKARLAFDGNRGLLARDTLLLSKACRDIPLVLEQPCNTIEEIRSIRSQLEHPVYLDENTADLNVVITAVGEGVCDGFGFKVTRLGGLGNLRVARDICKARSMPHTCDDAWGGDIIAAACVHMGATVSPRLNEGVWIAQPYIDGHYDPDNGIAVTDGQIPLPAGLGLGITPRLESTQCVASYG